MVDDTDPNFRMSVVLCNGQRKIIFEDTKIVLCQLLPGSENDDWVPVGHLPFDPDLLDAFFGIRTLPKMDQTGGPLSPLTCGDLVP